jgi:hypothetical protein
MRQSPTPVLEKARRLHPLLGFSSVGAMHGFFQIRGLSIISSGHCHEGDATAGWEHVSVSLPKRTPTWEEMCYVKSLFFEPEECVIQFHPPESKYVNIASTCLHLWKKADGSFELPPEVCA